MLLGAMDVQIGTFLRWASYVAIPVIPTMVELVGWPRWVDPPFWPSFHIIYWWALLVLAVMGWETYERGQKAVQWLAYWTDRGRLVGGNIEEIGEFMLSRPGDGGPTPSVQQIGAEILGQIVTVVSDLTHPPAGVHIMACMLVPVVEKTGEREHVTALQASIYNQNAGRNRSRIPINVPGPACEAYHYGRPAVIPDTSQEPYTKQFEGKPYRSVMGFPVNIGSRGGRKIAVVTVDATAPNTFTEEILREKGIEAAIFPYLKMIGLLRIAEQKGGVRGKR